MKKTVKTTDRKSEMAEAIKLICEEKRIDAEQIYQALEEAMVIAYKKSLPNKEADHQKLEASVSREDGTVKIYNRRMVTEAVESPDVHISLEEARKLDASCEEGDIILVDVTPKDFKRVAAQAAKSKLTELLKNAANKRTMDSIAEKEREMLTGVVQRFDDRGAILTSMVEDQRTMEFLLETKDMIPGEVLQIGDHIKVYVMEMRRRYMDRSDILVRVSRTEPDLVKRLFEMEVPEIAQAKVLIKAITREPGSRTKMAVTSTDPDIDPVGACVGPRSERVSRVVRELNDEKVDIVKWSNNPGEFVANALSPANVITVYRLLDDQEKETHPRFRVVVPDNQQSLAIGKEGQNVRLAAYLTGCSIDVLSESEEAAARALETQEDAGADIDINAIQESDFSVEDLDML